MNIPNPSVFIGIGGTGNQIIARTKKMFEDAYGDLTNLPIRFICFDFDVREIERTTRFTDLSNDNVPIPRTDSPFDRYEYLKSINGTEYFFPQNSGFLESRISKGARQVRGYGRFLTEMSIQNIESKISQAYNAVRNIRRNQNESNKSQLDSVTFHIAMSIAGGTGCGSFLNVAQAIRDLKLDDTEIFGYGITYSIFRVQLGYNHTPNVASNTYASILDLDYLMNANSNNPITYNINLRESTLKCPLFDQFYIIDNETTMGHSVGDIDELNDAVSISLFSAAGASGDNVASGISNTDWKQRTFDIAPKTGWVHGLGACQLIYDGKELASIYAEKAAIEIIKQMRNCEGDMLQEAINWTQSPNVQIREDGSQYDQLIDQIYQVKVNDLNNIDPKDSLNEIMSAVEKYINSAPNFPTDNDITKLTGSLNMKLEGKVNAMLHEPNAIGNTIAFIDALEKRLNYHKGEMDSEYQTFVDSVEKKMQVLKKNYQEYERYSKKIFASKAKKEEQLEDLVCVPAKKILKDNLEAKRRQKASQIFLSLLQTTHQLSAKVQSIDGALNKISQQLTEDVSYKQNRSASGSTFTIDLSSEDRLNLTLENGFTNHVSSFAAWLDDNALSLLKIDPATSDLKDAFYYYTRNMEYAGVDATGKKIYKKSPNITFPIFEKYENILVDEKLAQIKQSNPADYKALISDIDKLSARLLLIDGHGLSVPGVNNQSPENASNNFYIISHYNQTQGQGGSQVVVEPTLKQDSNYVDNHGARFAAIDSDYFRQRMIFNRVDYAFIPYCVKAIDKAYDEYKRALDASDKAISGQTQAHPHFDKVLYERMRKEDFKLKPESTNEAMLYWVLGNIPGFGWETFIEEARIMEKDKNGYTQKMIRKEDVEHQKYIRFAKNSYQFWDENSARKGKDGKWKKIGETDRKHAFESFRSDYLPGMLPELVKRLKDIIDTEGKGYIKDLVNRITKPEDLQSTNSDEPFYDYIDKVAIGNKNSATVLATDSDEADQYHAEWDFITTKLQDAIDNLK